MTIRSRQIKFVAIAALALVVWRMAGSSTADVAAVARAPREFLAMHCYACHDSLTRKGDLDLSALNADYADPKNFAVWVKVYDRVHDLEMPPKSAPQPDETERAAFLKSILQPMLAADADRTRKEGRAVWRRMNRYEYENTLRDLLDAPWLQIKELLPEDGEAHRFNKVGEALGVSHVQMSRYLMAAEYALREVMAPEASRPRASIKRFYAREQRGFTSHVEFSQFNTASERATFPLVGNLADIAVLKREAPRKFQDVRELKNLLAADQRLIARNLARQLIVFATGAPVRFGDRPQVETILDHAAQRGYGVKALIKAIVESKLFQYK